MQNSNILIVDDTISNLDILIELLDEYNIIEATNGLDALEILETEDIDLLLLDILMPDMDGFELCSKIKSNQRTKNIPVIFITVSDDEESITKAFDVGGYDYVKKPFKPKELLARVATQLNLQKLKQKEKVFDKNVALSDLIQNIAHQWRQPLSGISTIASAISVKKELGMITESEIIENCNKIVEITDTLSLTINNFENLFDKTLDATNYNIFDVIEENYNTIFVHDIEDLKIIMNIDDKVELFCSLTALLEVFRLLISNSINAFKETAVENKIIFVNVKFYKQDKVYIEIYDTANGIEPFILGKVFEPYFTTQHQSQGKGLGLYIVQNIVSNFLSGSITVRNHSFKYKNIKLKGAKFDIILDL